jgi:tRNA (cmo5U34)-methyltransferase
MLNDNSIYRDNLKPELLFTGPIADNYQLLNLLCPAATKISQLIGQLLTTFNPKNATSYLDILEIGCGTGITTLYLFRSQANLQLTAIDNSPDMLAQAHRNLTSELETERLVLREIDALSHLREQPANSVDVVASGYTLHNFLNNYRALVVAEVFRVLKPGGIFVNGDRYALDDPDEQLRLIQTEVRDYFRIFLDINRPDLLEHWIVHLFSDESPHHSMRLTPALEDMAQAGFEAITVHYREGVNTLISGTKPWP